MVLPLMPPDRRRSLFGTVTDLYQRLSSKSTMKLALLRFNEKMFASPTSYTQQHSTEPAIPEQQACLWIQVKRQSLQLPSIVSKIDRISGFRASSMRVMDLSEEWQACWNPFGKYSSDLHCLENCSGIIESTSELLPNFDLAMSGLTKGALGARRQSPRSFPQSPEDSDGRSSICSARRRS